MPAKRRGARRAVPKKKSAARLLEVLGRAVMDETFREQLLAGEPAFLRGLGLSRHERQTISSVKREELEPLARKIGEVYQGPDKKRMPSDSPSRRPEWSPPPGGPSPNHRPGPFPKPITEPFQRPEPTPSEPVTSPEETDR